MGGGGSLGLGGKTAENGGYIADSFGGSHIFFLFFLSALDLIIQYQGGEETLNIIHLAGI